MVESQPPSFAAIAKEDLSCPICYELLKAPNIPKDLPDCQHVCCEICLEQLVEKNNSENNNSTVVCPECRSINKVPDGGITDFKTNMRLRNLAEKQSIYEAQKFKRGINTCEQSKTTDDKTDEDGVHNMPRKRGKCPRHHTNDALFYCLTCDDSICQQCVVPDHLKHEVTEQDILMPKQQTQIDEKIKAVEEVLRRQKKLSTQCDYMEREFQQSKQAELAKINQCANQRVALFREERKRLRDQLAIFQSQQPYLGIVNEDKKLLQTKIDALATIREDVEKSDDMDFMNRHVAITMQLKELCRDQPLVSLTVQAPNVPKFIRNPGLGNTPVLCKIVKKPVFTNPQQIESTEDTYDEIPSRGADVEPMYACTLPRQPQIGAGAESTKEGEYSNADHMIERVAEATATTLPRNSRLIALRPLDEYDNFLNARSVAFGNDILAVCDSKTNTVTVYSKVNRQCLQKIATLKVDRPRDVAVVANGDIVIANSVNVLIFSSASNYKHKSIVQITGAVNKPRKDSISSVVNNSGRGFLVGDTARCMITRHGDQGELLESIPVNIRPFRMAVNQYNHIAVADSQSGKVLVMDLSVDESPQTLLQFNKVQGLCFQPSSRPLDCDSLLVTKRKTNSLRLSIRKELPDHGSVISVARSSVGDVSHPLQTLAEGLYKPGGITFISNSTVAVADGKTIKTYRCIYSAGESA